MDKEPKVQSGDEGQPQEPIVQDLVFKGYPSIELSTRDKFIKAIKDHGFDNEEILWVASQKIHGSNFSVHCTGQVVRYGRRTDFLTKEIPIKQIDVKKYFNQSFYDAANYVSIIQEKLPIVYNDIKAAFPDMIKFAIYGQYFGGNWPEPTNKKFKPVQKGISYCPQHQFMAFDIKITTSEINFWVDATQIADLLKDNIKSIPIYAQGKFSQIYEIETKIDSTIPELLGLKKLENNIIEGLVLRPNKTIFFKNHDRVILKKKNAEFNEVAYKPGEKKPAGKKQKVLDPALVPFMQFLDAYLNFNRLESVISKFPDVKDRNKIKLQVVNDIWADAVKDEWKAPEGDLEKMVKNQLGVRTMKLLNEYFVKH